MKFRTTKPCLLLLLLLTLLACNRSTQSRITGRWELRGVHEAGSTQTDQPEASPSLIYEFRKGGTLAFSQKGQLGTDTCQYSIVKEGQQEYLTFTDPKTQAYKFSILKLSQDTLELGIEKVILQFIKQQ